MDDFWTSPSAHRLITFDLNEWFLKIEWISYRWHLLFRLLLKCKFWLIEYLNMKSSHLLTCSMELQPPAPERRLNTPSHLTSQCLLHPVQTCVSCVFEIVPLSLKCTRVPHFEEADTAERDFLERWSSSGRSRRRFDESTAQPSALKPWRLLETRPCGALSCQKGAATASKCILQGPLVGFGRESGLSLALKVSDKKY